MEPPQRTRRLQCGGLLVLAVCACLATMRLTAHPQRAMGGVSDWPAVRFVRRVEDIPARELGLATVEGLQAGLDPDPLWRERPWYPFALLPFWLLALWLTRGGRRRRAVGIALWALALFIAVFEAAYLREEYLPFASGWLGEVEKFGAWAFVVTLLFYRRKPYRRLDAVEAAIGSQALLGVVHFATLPGTMARGWLGQYPSESVFRAVALNFPPAFWIACAALIVVAVPTYVCVGNRVARAPTAPG